MTVFFIERDERTKSVRVCWSYKLVCATMLFSFPSSWIPLAYQLKSTMSDIEFMLNSLGKKKKRKQKKHRHTHTQRGGDGSDSVSRFEF